MDLGGRWQAVPASDELRRVLPDPDYDDRGWDQMAVPGHWRSQPGFADADGPIFYRHRFAAQALEDGQRAWLTFEGLFYQSDVWLDGSYLGDTEGYFAPQTFEISDQVRQRDEHLLAVELSCAPPADLRHKHSLTGVFQHWDAIDPAWNPGGIWAPVGVTTSGPVRLQTLRVRCREASAERAVLDLEAVLHTAEARAVTLQTTLAPQRPTPARPAATPGPPPDTTATPGPPGATPAARAATTARQRPTPAPPAATPALSAVAAAAEEHNLAAGSNRVRWRLTVERPALWWPHALGERPLHELTLDVVVDGRSSDRRVVTTGLRQVRVSNFVARVNGERLFLKGANLGPARRALGEVTPDEVHRDLTLARAAGLDLLRVHAHIGRPELYAEADRVGMLLWQDLPLQWRYGQVRRQAVRQARQAVDLLGHHPAIAMWCAHDEPSRPGPVPGGGAGPRRAAGVALSQILPSWNRTALDRSLRRALERADSSRPVIAHAGVPPHPTGGTDTHLSLGWERGDGRDLPGLLSRWPVLARFVGSFGPAAVPSSAGFMQPGRWPDLDWEELERAHGLDRTTFERRAAPGTHESFDEWRDATQRYQADVVRHHVETLRRLKYRPTGGFCHALLADAQPGVTRALLDHDRVPKLGYDALTAACAPVIVVADRPAAAYAPGTRVDLAVHAVSDLRRALTDIEATAVLAWPGGSQRWRWSGGVPVDACVRVGRVVTTLPAEADPGPLTLDLSLRWRLDDAASGVSSVTNTYQSRVSVGPTRKSSHTLRGGKAR